jgi:hypothetical protein
MDELTTIEVRQVLARADMYSFPEAARYAASLGMRWDEIAGYADAPEEWLAVYEGAKDDEVVRERARFHLKGLCRTLEECLAVAGAAHRIGDRGLERYFIGVLDEPEDFQSRLLLYEGSETGSRLNARAYERLLEMRLTSDQWLEVLRSTSRASKRRREIVRRFAHMLPTRKLRRRMRTELGPYSRLADLLDAPQGQLRMPLTEEVAPVPQLSTGRSRHTTK